MARSTAAEAPSRARCESCGTGLSYQAWEQGDAFCRMCRQVAAVPAATYVRGPRGGAEPARVRRPAPEASQEALLDELIASLEAEAALFPGETAPRPESVKAVLHDIGFGQSSRELPWAAWGFAGGFCANVIVAKYAQMTSGASMTEFLPAFLIGGIVAGAACAGIGWGLAKLRE